MSDTRIASTAPATSWGSVLGGWMATIGASVIFAPIVAGLVAAIDVREGDLAAAVPVVVGVLLSYVIGGYVAGRMAGYRTSWHGMMTAFFSLFIVLLVLLMGGLADRGVFAASGIRSLGDLIPGVRDLNVDSIGNALSFGAILGFLAAIFGGWLGGLLAPSHSILPVPVTRDRVPAVPAIVERREVRERTRLVPSFGRKGGERVEPDAQDEVHTSRVERS